MQTNLFLDSSSVKTISFTQILAQHHSWALLWLKKKKVTQFYISSITKAWKNELLGCVLSTHMCAHTCAEVHKWSCFQRFMLFCVAESQNKVYKCRKLDTGKYIFKLSTTKLQNARLQKFTFNMLRSNLGYIHLPPHQCACNSKKHKETNKKIPTLFFLTISDF